jgi:phosphoenolpyruvate-protein phosphotransferase (PTS system enzyme I)
MVAHDFTYEKPVFWRIIASIVEAARKTGKPLSICGEMAGDPQYVPKLIEYGIETVSVSTRRISAARMAVKGMGKRKTP